MKEWVKDHILTLLRAVLLLVCVVGVIIYFATTSGISVDTLLQISLDHPVEAILIVWALYAVKGATVFFPLILLEILVGNMFPVWAAIPINLVGLMILMTVPYGIGRAAGRESIGKALQQSPKLNGILGRLKDNSLFLCFELRLIGCLPEDLITMYFGAIKMPFWKNLVAGVLGFLPKMIMATILGKAIRDPGSPMFWAAIVLTVLLIAGSAMLYFLYQRKNHAEES